MTLNDLIKLGNTCKQHDIIKDECGVCEIFAIQMTKAIKTREEENRDIGIRQRFEESGSYQEFLKEKIANQSWTVLTCKRCSILFAVPKNYAKRYEYCSRSCRYNQMYVLV